VGSGVALLVAEPVGAGDGAIGSTGVGLEVMADGDTAGSAAALTVVSG
jgi:hypothetical protein